jgi:hypothetical protein
VKNWSTTEALSRLYFYALELLGEAEVSDTSSFHTSSGPAPPGAAVVVWMLQFLAGEQRRIAGRVRGAQHRLELREYRLVLWGRRPGHGSHAGARGQHPRSHGQSGGNSGRGARIKRASHLAHVGSGRRTRRGAAGEGDARSRPLGQQQAQFFEGAHEKQNSSTVPRVNANVLLAATFSRPAPATADLHHSPSDISIIWSQPRSENVKCKIPQVNNS